MGEVTIEVPDPPGTGTNAEPEVTEKETTKETKTTETEKTERDA